MSTYEKLEKLMKETDYSKKPVKLKKKDFWSQVVENNDNPDEWKWN